MFNIYFQIKESNVHSTTVSDRRFLTTNNQKSLLNLMIFFRTFDSLHFNFWSDRKYFLHSCPQISRAGHEGDIIFRFINRNRMVFNRWPFVRFWLCSLCSTPCSSSAWPSPSAFQSCSPPMARPSTPGCSPCSYWLFKYHWMAPHGQLWRWL